MAEDILKDVIPADAKITLQPGKKENVQSTLNNAIANAIGPTNVPDLVKLLRAGGSIDYGSVAEELSKSLPPKNMVTVQGRNEGTPGIGDTGNLELGDEFSAYIVFIGADIENLGGSQEEDKPVDEVIQLSDQNEQPADETDTDEKITVEWYISLYGDDEDVTVTYMLAACDMICGGYNADVTG